jgi:hypothetical protein
MSHPLVEKSFRLADLLLLAFICIRHLKLHPWSLANHKLRIRINDALRIAVVRYLIPDTVPQYLTHQWTIGRRGTQCICIFPMPRGMLAAGRLVVSVVSLHVPPIFTPQIVHPLWSRCAYLPVYLISPVIQNHLMVRFHKFKISEGIIGCFLVLPIPIKLNP